ncbi:MAG TPA: hypothetical protein VMD07_00040, partial [Candidatus Acidoferrales bacterium]|nr:hypothetical protein [Candidatus Acidoferrales bacterium]
TLWGPLLGALIYVLGKEILSTITPAWEIFLGGIFIACVIGFPRGILGTVITAMTARNNGVKYDEAEAPEAEPAGISA